jgi:hypothetical protein
LKIVRQFDRLIAGDEGGDRDDAPVPHGQPRPLPEIAAHDVLGIFFKGGRDGPNVFGRGHGSCSFDDCLLTVGRAGDDRKRKYGCREKLH